MQRVKFLISYLVLKASGNMFIQLSFDDSLILSQSSSRHSNLKVGQISHQSWVMGNDSLRSLPPCISLKEQIYKVHGLLGSLRKLESNLEFYFGERRRPAVLGQIAHLVASITLNSARSCVMQSAFLTQGTVSNIPIVFSWSDSIRPEGFLSSVLLWLVIIVAFVGVGGTVVIVIIVAVVVVVESSSVVKLSFVIT
ncbi:hypothetical protein Tco_0688489 [Tanacetum coccineum]